MTGELPLAQEAAPSRPAGAASPSLEVSRIFPLLTAVIFLLDQATKYLVQVGLPLGRSISLGFFDLHHVHNRGAAFGIMPSGGAVFIIVAVAVLIGAMVLHARIREQGVAVTVAVGLIAGGTLGNLLDRLRFGYVVDFIDLRWWPVFNVADSAICIGVALLLWKMLLGAKEA